MQRKFARPVVLSVALAVCSLLHAAPTLAAPPEPGTVVTQADVEKLLKGKFKSEVVEPGALSYSEEGGAYRIVMVTLWPANGKTLAALKEQLAQDGEPAEDVPGVGDAAVYRPQRSQVTVEKKSKAGELLWLTVDVQGSPSAEENKRLAIELGKLGAPRI
jgi:hypothetical protein